MDLWELRTKAEKKEKGRNNSTNNKMRFIRSSK